MKLKNNLAAVLCALTALAAVGCGSGSSTTTTKVNDGPDSTPAAVTEAPVVQNEVNDGGQNDITDPSADNTESLVNTPAFGYGYREYDEIRFEKTAEYDLAQTDLSYLCKADEIVSVRYGSASSVENTGNYQTIKDDVLYISRDLIGLTEREYTMDMNSGEAIGSYDSTVYYEKESDRGYYLATGPDEELNPDSCVFICNNVSELSDDRTYADLNALKQGFEQYVDQILYLFTEEKALRSYDMKDENGKEYYAIVLRFIGDAECEVIFDKETKKLLYVDGVLSSLEVNVPFDLNSAVSAARPLESKEEYDSQHFILGYHLYQDLLPKLEGQTEQ